MGISKRDAATLEKCLCSTERSFNEKEIIMHLSEDNHDVGILKSGTAYLAGTNIDGDKSIIDYYEQNNLFGSRFAPVNEMSSYYILAKTKCVVTFVDYHKLIACCHKNCDRHIQLIDNLINISVRKAQMHTDILSRRSIRNKLIAFFEYLREQSESDSFVIPFSLAELADYLAVNRSAMMRELKKMNDEGIIRSEGCSITMLM